MEQVLEFLNKAGVYFLATSEGGQPHVRPIGFVMELDGKLAFCTGNNKRMCQQLTANPKVEIACYNGQDTLRITGRAVFSTTEESQSKVFEVMPGLSEMYSVGDGILEVYYLEDAKAVISFMGNNSQEIAL